MSRIESMSRIAVNKIVGNKSRMTTINLLLQNNKKKQMNIYYISKYTKLTKNPTKHKVSPLSSGWAN